VAEFQALELRFNPLHTEPKRKPAEE
jgi:hypothetical protein